MMLSDFMTLMRDILVWVPKHFSRPIIIRVPVLTFARIAGFARMTFQRSQCDGCGRWISYPIHVGGTYWGAEEGGRVVVKCRCRSCNKQRGGER
jgi:hypothetical protein